MTPSLRHPPAQLSAFGAVWLAFVCMLGAFACLHIVTWLWGALAGVSYAEASAAVHRQVVLTTLCQLLAMGATATLALRMAAEPGRAREALGLRRATPGALALLFAAGLCLQLPLSELANVLHTHVFGPQSLAEQKALAELLAPDSPALRLVVWLCLGLLVPAAEELLFRGALLTGLLPTQGRAGAVLVSAALFGLCHVKPVPIAYAFVAGLLLGAVRLRGGSVRASFALHAGVNTLPVVIGPDTLPVTGFNVPSSETSHLPPALWLGGLAAGFVLTVLALRNPPLGE